MDVAQPLRRRGGPRANLVGCRRAVGREDAHDHEAQRGDGARGNDQRHANEVRGRPDENALSARRALDAIGRIDAGRRGDKSLVASGVLSFFFGPLGWLYAAPAREAVPASLLYILGAAMLRFLPFVWWMFAPFLGILSFASALVGVLYASQHNRNGRPTALLEDDDLPRLPGRRD